MHELWSGTVHLIDRVVLLIGTGETGQRDGER